MRSTLIRQSEGYGYDNTLLPNYDGFIIIKPGFLKYTDEIIKELHIRDFSIIEAEEKTLSKRDAEMIYACHRGKNFFEELVRYMMSGPCIGMAVLSPFSDRESSIEALKSLKEKYRRRYGIDATRNVIHSSDSYQSVLYEAEVFFDDPSFKLT